MSTPAPVPVRTKVLFGMGTTAEQVCLYSFGFLIMLYYNQVLGLPATLAGLGPGLALVFDAITDPLVGSWSDRFKSKKWGRRHPFMLVAPIPVAVSFYCVFVPPDGLSTTQLFTWYIVFSVLVRSCMTLFFVPHLAFGGEMSKDYVERSSIMSYNNLGGYLGSAGAHWFGLTFFFMTTAEYENGLLNPDAYPRFALVATIIILIALYGCAWFTRDRIPTLSQPKADEPPFNARSFVQDIVEVLKNKNYLYLLLGLFFLSITLGMRSAFNNYMNVFYWEFASEQIRWLIIGSLTGYVIGFITSYRLHRRFDKRIVIVISCIGYALADALPVCLRVLGYFPENHTPALFPSIVAFHAVGSASMSILNISVMSALADIADENEVRFGHRQEGMLYSARTFFSKADRAIGIFVAGVVLDVIAFPAKAVPGEIDEDVIFMLGIADSPVTIVPAVIAALFYAGYRINKDIHAEIQAKLRDNPSG